MSVCGIAAWFHPTVDALSTPGLPFGYRWRLLIFQPIAILIYLINALSLWLSRTPYTVIKIPARGGGQILSLVYLPDPLSDDCNSHTQESDLSQSKLRPLHLDIHGGAFIGGHPESGYRFCAAVSKRTGAVVVSTTYRFAPRHAFPAAIDDVDDVVSWLLENAEARFGADPNSLTVGGSSAGGNLALATSLKRNPSDNRVKAVIGFYAPIDISIPPWLKPRPNQATRDPLSFLRLLFDSYGASARPDNTDDPRSSPCKAPVSSLPNRILLIVPTIDILVAEQLEFAKRVNDVQKRYQHEEVVQLMVMDDCLHGWLELPSFVINEKTRTEVFDRCIDFLNDTYSRLRQDRKPNSTSTAAHDAARARYAKPNILVLDASQT